MIGIGIDAGIEYTKVVALKDDGSYEASCIKNELVLEDKVTAQAISKVLPDFNAKQNELFNVVKTGISREELSIPGLNYPELVCLAEGLNMLYPDEEYVLDTGARKFLMARCKKGKVLKHTSGEKCASGAGAYLNMVSSFLHLDIQTMNELYFEGSGEIALETKCAVFAESEIISMIHNKVPVAEVVRGAFQGLARRSLSPVISIDAKDHVLVVGGVIQIPAYLDALKNASLLSVTTIPEAQIVLAIGAAVLAQRQQKGGLGCLQLE